MKREDIIETIVSIMKEILDDEKIEITEKTAKGELEEWDSVVHMTLVAALEEEFSVRFDLDEIVCMDSIGRMIECVGRKSVNKIS